MSNSTYSGGFLGGSGGDSLGGFGYGIGVSVGILLLITTITLTSYYCTRGEQLPSSETTPAGRRRRPDEFPRLPERCIVLDVGLDEATIRSYPKLLYSETTKVKMTSDRSTTATCCSICLADYKGRDTLRELPECGHLFHRRCVDPWLRLHPTCPVCRTSPMPTPLSTPLAEVVPLASRRD